MDVEKKIEGIIRSDRLDDLSLKYLPPVSDTPDNYYFISYSHKDYKAVYTDIYALQAEGVNVWYDRAMPVGVSWKETAERYIRPSRCAGVVFYISDNSLLSDAIHEEMAFAKQCGKSCLTINLPSGDGKTYSAKAMLDALIGKGADISAAKNTFMKEFFNDEVLYLPYSASAEQKASKILTLKKPPLFKVEFLYDGACITAINDIEITEIKKEDLIFVDKYGRPKDLVGIGPCAFANCISLRSIDLPNSVRQIGDYAFYGCSSLEFVGNTENLDRVGKSAFEFCSKIQAFNLGRVKIADDAVFKDCASLKSVKGKLLQTIGNRAFENCLNLEEISLTPLIETIGNEAFSSSAKLKLLLPPLLRNVGIRAFHANADIDSAGNDIVMKEGNLIDARKKTLLWGSKDGVIPDDGSVERIAEYAFESRDFSSVVIPDSVTEIGAKAFVYCRNLNDVKFGRNLKTVGDEAFSCCRHDYEFEIDDILYNLSSAKK